jgi:hypothetical protein
MKVSTTVQTPEGSVKFEGELSQQETDLVIQIGLSQLFEMGMIPFVVRSEEEASALVSNSNSTTVQ